MDVRVVLAGLFVFPCLCKTGYDSGEQSSGYLHLTNTTRVKRVFFGQPLLDVNAYDVMKYFVFITNGACGSGYLGRIDHALFGSCDPPIVGWGVCGGALISEYTVQTACHCIAQWTTMNDTHFKTNPRSVWEHQYVMYMGYFDVTKMKDGSRAIMFIHHQRCIKVRSDPEFNRGKPGEGGQVTHDFGIIFGRTPLVKNNLLIREAPTYEVSELRRVFKKVQSEEHVCLLAGWGQSRLFENPDEAIGMGMSLRSRFLQHTWDRVMNYRRCANTFQGLASFLIRSRLYKHKNYTYKAFATWMCSKKFGKMSASLGRGDSGSPVTCDDKYVGIAYGNGDEEVAVVMALQQNEIGGFPFIMVAPACKQEGLGRNMFMKKLVAFIRNTYATYNNFMASALLFLSYIGNLYQAC